MSAGHIFDTTTPRSSRIGQPEYNSDADWRHFFAKYHDKCIRFAVHLFPSRPDVAEDAFAMLVEQIYTNPTILHRKPNVHFRTVLAKRIRNAAIEIFRRERRDQRERYENLTEPLLPKTTNQDYDRERLCLLTIELIRRDMLRPDYQNGRFTREFDSLDLEIWQAMQSRDATYSAVGKTFGIRGNDRIKDAVTRVDARIAREAETILSSLDLI